MKLGLGTPMRIDEVVRDLAFEFGSAVLVDPPPSSGVAVPSSSADVTAPRDEEEAA